ncbi:thioesterase-like superfamily protein [Mycobacteroides abscessus MAB_091912_2446]|uniref:Thioesterase-like superfamily protein n=1 Tax=Mycobacteroides abscessus MAB_091912_2446 TaxID=1335414 RepID=A0A829M6E4_9MYCO|nr:thioesterase-like superfamily protein [Mycobacteroides abscessus MAB_091912_2446]
MFVGGHPTVNPPRTFGGQLMAQSLVASGRTVSEKLSLAAISTHFINGGDPELDIEFRVQRLRDERSFANRRVDAVQGDLLLSSALVSYLKDSPGLEHAVNPPVVADPETLPSIDEHLVGYEETVPMFVAALKPIEWRYDNDPAWVLKAKSQRLEHNRVWMKTHAALPDDPVLHSAALVYSSDTTILDSIITTHGLSWGYDRIFAATINHSVWFHRPCGSMTGCCMPPSRRSPRRAGEWVQDGTSIATERCWPVLSRKALSNTSRGGHDSNSFSAGAGSHRYHHHFHHQGPREAQRREAPVGHHRARFSCLRTHIVVCHREE